MKHGIENEVEKVSFDCSSRMGKRPLERIVASVLSLYIPETYTCFACVHWMGWNAFVKNARGWLEDCKISAAKEEAMVWVVPKPSPMPPL